MTDDLQPVGPGHAALLAGMHRICFLEAWDAKAMAELLAMPGAYGFIAGQLTAARPEVKGFILCRAAAGEAEVLTLMVLPPYRRQKVAKELMAAAMDAGRRAGASEFFLEVAADNISGQAFYAAEGFQEVGRRPRYYRGEIDALVLRHDL